MSPLPPANVSLSKKSWKESRADDWSEPQPVWSSSFWRVPPSSSSLPRINPSRPIGGQVRSSLQDPSCSPLGMRGGTSTWRSTNVTEGCGDEGGMAAVSEPGASIDPSTPADSSDVGCKVWNLPVEDVELELGHSWLLCSYFVLAKLPLIDGEDILVILNMKQPTGAHYSPLEWHCRPQSNLLLMNLWNMSQAFHFWYLW